MFHRGVVSEGQLEDRNKSERREGKIQTRHPQVADLYQVSVTEKGCALALEWQAVEGRQTWQRTREGACLLHTNLPPGQPEQLWKRYLQLTETEAAFLALKSALSMRPIFHQSERRAKAHILVAFLGYGLWPKLTHLLIQKVSTLSPTKALGLLGTLVGADIAQNVRVVAKAGGQKTPPIPASTDRPGERFRRPFPPRAPPPAHSVLADGVCTPTQTVGPPSRIRFRMSREGDK